MKYTTMLVVLAASAALAGCGDKLKSSASVSGEGGQKLVLTKPSAVTIRRGEMAKLDIHVTRTNVTGDIGVTFADLPDGVSVIDWTNKISGDKITYTLKASDAAALVDKSVAKVTATAPSGVAVTESFDVSVKEKETATGK